MTSMQSSVNWICSKKRVRKLEARSIGTPQYTGENTQGKNTQEKK